MLFFKLTKKIRRNFVFLRIICFFITLANLLISHLFKALSTKALIEIVLGNVRTSGIIEHNTRTLTLGGILGLTEKL